MVRPKTYTEDLRNALIDGAAEIVAARGLDGLSLRTLAADHGTSTNAIYAMFGGKSGLVATVLEKAAAGFADAQAASVVGDDVFADLDALGLAYRRWAVDNPALYTVMFGGRAYEPDDGSSDAGGGGADACAGEPADPSGDDPFALGVQRGRSPLVDVVTRGVDQGLFLDAPVAMIVASIWGSVHGLVSLELAPWADLPTGGVREIIYRNHLDAIRRGWTRPGLPGPEPEPVHAGSARGRRQPDAI